MIAQCTRQYQHTHILTSSGIQLVVLLYDAAIQSIELARRGMEANNLAEKGRFLGRAISIVGELNGVLDFERGGEIARLLRRIYDYVLTELVAANARNKTHHLDGPVRCLSTLREAWVEVAAQQKAPVGAGRDVP